MKIRMINITNRTTQYFSTICNKILCLENAKKNKKYEKSNIGSVWPNARIYVIP